MNFEEYQKQSVKTAIYPTINDIQNANNNDNNIYYPVLGLCSEAGEIAGKVKKIMRDNNGRITENHVDELKKELGDVLWYLAAICNELDISLSDVAKYNVEKLLSRKERGVLSGSGDNR